MAKQTVALVGGGLVGSLLAMGLARRGYQVEVWEKRSDLRQKEGSEGRSINLAISTRGLHALAQLGKADAVLQTAIPMRGRMVHLPKGSPQFQPYSERAGDAIHSISRAGLNRLLLNWAEESGKVRFHFSSPVSAVDLDRKQLLSESWHPYEILIGTDGSASAVRSSLQQRLGMKVEDSTLSHGYKELVMPGHFVMEKHALHIWPRGHFMLIALPNEDGSFTCTLFLPLEGKDSFSELKSPAQVETFFLTHFPDALERLPNLSVEYFQRPVGKMVTIRAERWHDGSSAMLLGDAAHAIVPFFGQGMNCGFEDVTALLRAIDSGSSWSEIFPQVESERKRNANAIADMAIENFYEMRDKVADAKFLAQRAIEKRLSQAFPDRYVNRYQLVSFTRVPYAEAHAIGEIQSQILDELYLRSPNASEVDLIAAESMIEQRLSPRMKGISLDDLRRI